MRGLTLSKLGKDGRIWIKFSLRRGLRDKSDEMSRNVKRLDEQIEKQKIFQSYKIMQKSTWTGGHTSNVISLDVNKEGVVASGGEGELNVWSKDGSSHNKLLCPSTSTQLDDSKDINGVCFCVKNPERLYASCRNKVFGYDLRNPSSTVCEFEFNQDEINQVAIHYKGGFLAACDDSGDIKVIDVLSGRLFKTLRGRNDNICSTVQFRPNRPWEILSGSMDYRIISWDFSSGRALQELNVQELDEDSNQGAYFLNPPFVHSVHMAGDGRMFAAGLGIQKMYILMHNKI